MSLEIKKKKKKKNRVFIGFLMPGIPYESKYIRTLNYSGMNCRKV